MLRILLVNISCANRSKYPFPNWSRVYPPDFRLAILLGKSFDLSLGMVFYKHVEAYSESFSSDFNFVANLYLFLCPLFSLYMPPPDVFCQGSGNVFFVLNGLDGAPFS